MYVILFKIRSQRIGVIAKGRYSVMKRHQWKPLLLMCLFLATPVSAAAAMPIMVSAAEATSGGRRYNYNFRQPLYRRRMGVNPIVLANFRRPGLGHGHRYHEGLSGLPLQRYRKSLRVHTGRNRGYRCMFRTQLASSLRRRYSRVTALYLIPEQEATSLIPDKLIISLTPM